MIYPTINEKYELDDLNGNFEELNIRTVNGVSWGENQNVVVTANPLSTDLTTQDLNTITTIGFYHAGGANTSANKPSGTAAFGLIVYKTAGGYTTQDLTETSLNQHRRWSRQYNSITWSAWIEIYTSRLDGSYTPTASDLGTVTTHLAMRKGGVGRYKLVADSGTWTAGTNYIVCTLSSNYRPTVEIKKEMYLHNGFGALLTIATTGVVNILPRQNMSAQPVRIDETYTI